MEHIKLLLTIFNLILGSIVIMFLFYKSQQFKAFKVFPLLAYYTVLFNLLMIGAITGKYIDLNLSFLSQIIEHSFYKLFSQIFFIVIFGGMLVLQYRIVNYFLKNKLRNAVKKLVLVYGILAILFFIAGICLFFYNNRTGDFFLERSGDLIFIGEIILLILLLVKGGKEKDKRQIRLTRSYSFLFLGRYLIIVVLLIFPQFIRFYLSIAVLYLLNSLPLIWTLIFYKEGNLLEKDTVFIGLPSNITAREQEIIELVLEGKSNKEIEDILCISSHTVKNHLYNIYKKANVKNRYGLIVKYSS